MFKTLRKYVGLVGILAIYLATATGALAQVQFVGMGDSIGEGVQSANASEWSQPFSYLNLIAYRMGATFPLPLIHTDLFAVVGDTGSRSRIAPTVNGLNLAVSGADVFSLQYDQANAITTADINSETDLVLFPRLGSQMQVAEALHPAIVACWIGNNDVLSAVTAFDHLDTSQMTSITDFFNYFFLMAGRLKAMNSKVVFGTIPDVSRIGFLVDRNDLIKFLGSDLGLPAGSRTSVVAMVLIGLGLLNPAVLQDPNYVLDPAELSAISQRIVVFNQIIRGVAQYNGMAVANIDTRFDQYSSNPPVFYGIPLTNKFLGGLFSLDGVHPSNIGHALVANEFISAFNASYGLNIAPLDSASLNYLFATDPFVDLNHNGRVRGRPFSGLLEFISALIGFSGDSESLPLTSAPSATFDAVDGNKSDTALLSKQAAKNFFDQYKKIKGKDLTKASTREVLDAFREIFGLDRFNKQRR